ncbi:MAG: hypothetical protein J3K34DRAFT_438990 [Monoraphidium minutum]|nr:MAG: hypothetical protein J3K34DRAFT_438990 [Monoraphidium minutum]
MNRILAADIAGFHKAHEFSAYALGAFVPLAAISSQGSGTQKLSDWALAVALPVHMHISTNACVTDYVPTRFRAPVRVAVLGASVVAYLGIMKLNLSGPGLTETVKTLWRKPAAKAEA